MVYLANSPFTAIDTAITRSSRRVVFCKKEVHAYIANFTRNPCAKDSFLRKLQFYRVQLHQKEIPEQMVYL